MSISSHMESMRLWSLHQTSKQGWKASALLSLSTLLSKSSPRYHLGWAVLVKLQWQHQHTASEDLLNDNSTKTYCKFSIAIASTLINRHLWLWSNTSSFSSISGLLSMLSIVHCTGQFLDIFPKSTPFITHFFGFPVNFFLISPNFM